MAKKSGQAFINELMYSVGKIQTLTADTNYRTIALNWLNNVIRDIASRNKRWWWLEKTATFPTVADQMSYDLPSDINENNIVDIRQTETPVKLRYVDQRSLDEMVPDPTQDSGDPYAYTIFADSLRLYPVPDSAITMTMRYIKTITVFTDGSGSTTDIPENWDSVVLDGLKVHGFRYEPEWGDANASTLLYEAGIKRMLQDNYGHQDDDGVSDSHRFGREEIDEPRFNPRGSFS